MDEIANIPALIKQYGLGATAWILLFSFIAWIVGKGARAAFANVATLLQQSSDMRASVLAELKVANTTIIELRARLTDADDAMRRERARHDEDMRRMQREVHSLEERIGQLNHDLQVAQGIFQASDQPHR